MPPLLPCGHDGAASGAPCRRRAAPAIVTADCSRKRWLQSHHIWHWPKGGPTDPDNLVAFCGYHHRLVHEGGWRIEGDPEGELRFVHPLGEALSTRPTPLRAEVQDRLVA